MNDDTIIRNAARDFLDGSAGASWAVEEREELRLALDRPQKTLYTQLLGTFPSEDERHEPRTLVRENLDDSIYMMTEIEDGVFVQWSACDKCHKHAGNCGCKGGPTMPAYITKWRDMRFKNSIKHRQRIATDDQVDEPDDPAPEEEARVGGSDARQNIDDGLASAQAAVAAQQSQEDASDVGF